MHDELSQQPGFSAGPLEDDRKSVFVYVYYYNMAEISNQKRLARISVHLHVLKNDQDVLKEALTLF